MFNARPITRLTARSLLCVAGVVLALAAAPAYGRIESDRQLAAILTRTPAPQIVTEGQQLQEAETHAAGISGAQAFWGVGRSMEPLYATNTAVVVVPVNYDGIKKGMTVVYVNRHGFRVAHSVVGETRGGYLAQGVNNNEPDADLVTPQNIIGVVVHAYASSESPFRLETTKRLVAKGKVTLTASQT